MPLLCLPTVCGGAWTLGGPPSDRQGGGKRPVGVYQTVVLSSGSVILNLALFLNNLIDEGTEGRALGCPHVHQPCDGGCQGARSLGTSP